MLDVRCWMYEYKNKGGTNGPPLFYYRQNRIIPA